MNIFDRIRRDELQDQAELLGKMSPREYAELRGVAPQLVYYRIRNKRIVYSPCPCCGRKVIDVREADSAFGFEETLPEEEDSPGSDVEAE